MSMEGGVDLSKVSATSATLPSGRNSEKEAKMGAFDDFLGILPTGRVAEWQKWQRVQPIVEELFPKQDDLAE